MRTTRGTDALARVDVKNNNDAGEMGTDSNRPHKRGKKQQSRRWLGGVCRPVLSGFAVPKRMRSARGSPSQAVPDLTRRERAGATLSSVANES